MPFGPKPIPPDRWFESKPLWARLMILLSGVTMNIVLALVVTTGMFVHYGSPYLSTTADSLFADGRARWPGFSTATASSRSMARQSTGKVSSRQ